MDLNPNHPINIAAREQYHKFCVILMIKFGVDVVEITAEDIQKLDSREGGANLAIVIASKTSPIILKIMSDDEADEAVKKAGGKPN